MSATVEIPLDGTPPAEPAAPADGWLSDTRGREYIPARGRTGVVYRRDSETVAQALERDAKGRADKPPKTAAKKRAKAPAPTEQELREIEAMLAEVLRSPAMACAAFGDTWAADHFTRQGPELARNLVFASRHNPWLREKLVAAAGDGAFAMRLGTMLWLAFSAVGYALPPIVWWTGLPLPQTARMMFGIPDRQEVARAAAQAPAPAAPAAS